jgi:hypothetical protein
MAAANEMTGKKVFEVPKLAEIMRNFAVFYSS